MRGGDFGTSRGVFRACERTLDRACTTRRTDLGRWRAENYDERLLDFYIRSSMAI